MKKITLVMSAIIMAALLAVSAFAAPVVFEADSENAFDITYTGTEGQYYAIVIVEGIVEEGGAPSITEESIQYINQQTAGVDGAVSFEDVLLRVDGTEATVFLGGSDIPDGPVLLGWVNKTEEATTFTVNGKVTSGTTKAATVTLTGAETYTATTVDGVYTISNVAAGTYKMVITAPGQLSYTKIALAVEADVAYKNIALGSGNVVEDAKVDKFDLADVLSFYGKKETTKGDCTGDEKVDKFDLADVLANYGKVAVEEN